MTPWPSLWRLALTSGWRWKRTANIVAAPRRKALAMRRREQILAVEPPAVAVERRSVR